MSAASSAAATSATTITAQAVKETFSVGVQWAFVVLGVALLVIQLSVAVAVYRLARKIDAFILFLSEVGDTVKSTEVRGSNGTESGNIYRPRAVVMIAHRPQGLNRGTPTIPGTGLTHGSAGV